MRISELTLLCYTLEELCANGCEWDELDSSVNLGAIFAHRLVSLKTKPILGKGTKLESVGSLLTLFFCYCRISTEDYKIVKTHSFMGVEHLKNARWIKMDWLCVLAMRQERTWFSCPTQPSPLSQMTRRSSAFGLLHALHAEAPSRRHRGASSRDTPTAAEDDPIADLAGGRISSSSFPQLPVIQRIPMETETFQRYVVDSFQSIWNAIYTLSRCGCDVDIDLNTQADDSLSVPEVKEGPMTRSKSKQLRKRFNLAVQDIVDSLEIGEANWSEPTICEEELSQAFTQLSLEQPPGIESSLAGGKSLTSEENALKLQEAYKFSFSSDEEQESQRQAPSIKDVREFPESDQVMHEKPQGNSYIKEPMHRRVVQEVDQGGPNQLPNQHQTRPGKLYSIFNIIAGSNSLSHA